MGKEKEVKQLSVEDGLRRKWELMGLERWEERGKVKLTFLRRGRPCGRGFVNELVCMAGTTQWPQGRSWHTVDTRLKLTLTPQIITFSLWKLAFPSHSSHFVSVSLLSPFLFLFLTSPHLLKYIGGRVVLTLKSNYLSFTCLSLPLIMNFKWKVKSLSFHSQNQSCGRGQHLSQYVVCHMGLKDSLVQYSTVCTLTHTRSYSIKLLFEPHLH